MSAVETAVPAPVDTAIPAPGLSRWRPGPARLAKLLLGLGLFGVGESLLVASKLGNSPWTVFAQGVARQTGMSVGAATIVTSVGVLCLWVPLRQRPGLGTILNALLIGLAIDATLAVLPDHIPALVRVALIPSGIALVGVGSGLYLTSYLGPGPRDGLMTGLHKRTGVSLRLVRTAIELSAVTIGIVLGGTFGVGTVAFAAAIGPAVQAAVHRIGGTDTSRL